MTLIPTFTDKARETALLEGKRGVRDFRATLYESNISGDELREIETAISGSVNLSNFRDNTWELQLNMAEDKDLDVFTDWVKLIVLLRDGETWLRYPMGLYRFDFPSGSDSRLMTGWDLVGKSPETLLLQDNADAGYKVSAGTGVLAAVRTILLNRGVPTSRINLPTTDKTLTRTMFFDPLQDAASTFWLRICNSLLAAGGFYALWCDNEGRFTTREIEDTLSATPSVTYGTTDSSDQMADGEISWEFSDERFANKVVVRSDNPDQTVPVWAVAEYRTQTPASPLTNYVYITDPSSRLAIENYAGGTVQGDAFTYPDIIAVNEAKKLARANLRIAIGTDQKLTLPTLTDPRRGPRESYGLDVYREDGTRLYAGRWRVTGWEMALDFTSMTHEIFREVSL